MYIYRYVHVYLISLMELLVSFHIYIYIIQMEMLGQKAPLAKSGHISTSFQRQKLSIAAAESLQRISPMNTLDRFMLPTLGTLPFLVGHRAAWGESQGFRRGGPPHGERSLPIRPQGQAPLYISDILFLFISIQFYSRCYLIFVWYVFCVFANGYFVIVFLWDVLIKSRDTRSCIY